MNDEKIMGAVFSKDESQILTWSNDGTVFVWDVETGIIWQSIKHNESVIRIGLSKDSNRIYTLHNDNMVRLWNTETGEAIGKPMKHEHNVRSAIFFKDGSLILTFSSDGTARLWDAETGEAMGEPIKHVKEEMEGIALLKDNSRILMVSSPDIVQLWNIDDADYDFPKEHLSLLVEVSTGTTMDDSGNVSVLNKEEWETKKQEYIKISEDHLKTCKYKSANIYLNRQKPFWGK